MQRDLAQILAVAIVWAFAGSCSTGNGVAGDAAIPNESGGRSVVDSAVVDGDARPRLTCTVRSDDFAVKLTLVRGSKLGNGECDHRFDGVESIQKMGMQPYFPPPDSSDVRPSMAIQPYETGLISVSAETVGVADEAAGHKPFALGKFDSEYPDNDDICHVRQLSAAEVEYQSFLAPGNGSGGTVSNNDGGEDGARSDSKGGGMCVPPKDPEPPTTFAATHVKYEFSDLKIYETRVLPGMIAAGELKYTQFIGADSCSATYTFAGLAPFSRCCVAPQDKSDTCLSEPEIPQPMRPGDEDGIFVACDSQAQVCGLTKNDPRGFAK